MRGFFAGPGGKRSPSAQRVARGKPPTWAEIREDARRTRWLWTLPIETGYAHSLIEVQREWSLDDVLLVLDRAGERQRQAEAARKAAQKGVRR